MDHKTIELLSIEEKLKKERELQEERPFLQLEIEEHVEIKQKEPEIEPRRVIIIDL